VGKIDLLVKEYEKHARLPWATGIAGPQKVWFVVYPPDQERRLRCRLQEFGTATLRAGHRWASCDLTNAFAEWMAAQEYRESYFEAPDDLEYALRDFHEYVAGLIKTILAAEDDSTVIGIYGVASLFGFMKVSELMEAVASSISGRLVVFFPGEHEGTNYRLLDARDGWNYLAVPITV